MRKQVTCECGWHAEGTEEELVPLVKQHGRDVHGMDVTTEQALAQLKPLD